MLDVRPNPLALVLVPIDKPLPEGENILIDDVETLEQIISEYPRPSENLGEADQ